ncbi:MAG: cystathionine gamma-synthase [Flavobacteriales bacterium]|nr:MAG: cystathionine gamma-synthase [Flavobacteriales bacterium]
MKFGTKVIHAGIEPDEATGAVMTPIYMTTTYAQKRPGEHKGYEYSRTQNPTRTTLEKNIAALENTKYGLCFASGMAAIDAIMRMLQPGDEVISSNDVYGGTYRLLKQVYEKVGIKSHFIPMQDTNKVLECINENTKMIWVETPTNPLLNIIDLEAIGKIAKENDLIFAVDNTFATPCLQNPIDFGAHISMHSVTKYLGGHSDVVMGAVAVNDDELAEKLYFHQNSIGAVPSPFDAFLVLRGLKTLHIRMERHSENGKAVAEFLQNHPKIDKVYYPGFESHPNHEVAKKQMSNFGGMVSFTLKGDDIDETLDIISKLKIFTLAESLGGVESLIGHPATMTHASIPPEVRHKTGVLDSLIRVSVGIEDKDDLIADLEQAFNS